MVSRQQAIASRVRAMEPGSRVSHAPAIQAAVSNRAVRAPRGIDRDRHQAGGSPWETGPLVVGIVSAQPVNGLVRRLTVLVGTRRAGTAQPMIVGPMIVGPAPQQIDRVPVEVRIDRVPVEVRIDRVPVGIVSAQPVNGLVRRSTVLVGTRRAGTAQPMTVGPAPQRIDRVPVEVRIVRVRPLLVTQIVR